MYALSTGNEVLIRLKWRALTVIKINGTSRGIIVSNDEANVTPQQLDFKSETVYSVLLQAFEHAHIIVPPIEDTMSVVVMLL